MTDETPSLDTALRRALDAADLANDAAEDLARLGRGNEAFVASVTAAHRRTTAIATGAAVGSLVALGLAALVYFRSVGDLNEAAGLQAETARVIAEEIVALRTSREEGDAATAALQQAVEGLPAQVTAALEAKAGDGPDPAQSAAALQRAIEARVDAARDEILAALAEVQLASPTEAAPDLAETLARIEAGLLRMTAAPANPKPATPRPPTPAKPAPQKPAPEPNPFSYP